MKVKSLTLRGFKSFADHTKIDIHDGITAIVGPNGCGKSNVSDAIRWVLGEQRPSAIRGARMEEAIFGGTEIRKPIQRAEVVLELSNESGVLPVPYPEVSIARVVYRQGEGQYSLNGTTCRLRDIVDLCRDTGLGSNAYALIEARMIDAILSDRAEERRHLFEEAAGIGRYKDRRRIATRRLEQADADLVRLDDLLGEVKSKVRSLAQQRTRASRQRELRARLLRLDVAITADSLDTMSTELDEVGAGLKGIDRELRSDGANQGSLEVQADEVRLSLSTIERDRATLARDVEKARRDVEEHERVELVSGERARTARERASAIRDELTRLRRNQEELAQRAEQAETDREVLAVETERVRDVTNALDGELRTYLTRARDLEAALIEADNARSSALRELESWNLSVQAAAHRATSDEQDLEQRQADLEALIHREAEARKRLEAELQVESELVPRVEAEHAVLVEAEGRSAHVARELSEARQEQGRTEGLLSTATARSASINTLLRSSTLLPKAVAELMAVREDLPGVRRPLADYLDAPPGWASAIEAFLGPYLHAVVVDDRQAAGRVERWLAKRAGDEALLLLLLDPGPVLVPTAARSDTTTPVTAQGAGEPWVRAFLYGVDFHGVADNRPGELSRAGSWLTPEGAYRDRLGVVRVGPVGDDTGILALRAELQTLAAEVERLDNRRRSLLAKVGECEQRASEAEIEVQRVRTRIAEFESAQRGAKADHAASEGLLARLREERTRLSDRVERLKAAVVTHGAKHGQQLARTRELEEAVDRTNADWMSASAASRGASQEVDTKRAEHHEAQLGLIRLEGKLEHQQALIDRLTERRVDNEARLVDLEEERDRLSESARESEQAASNAAAAAESAIEVYTAREGDLRVAEAKIDESRAKLAGMEATLRQARQLQRELTNRQHALEVRRAQLETEVANVRDRIEGEWGAPIDDLRARVGPPEDGDPTIWRSELAEVRGAISRIGPVNLLAEDEYAEEKTRLEFLTRQREDLETAKEDLRSSLRTVNKEAAAALTETFAKIRENFHRTFETLFEGGDCDVWLADPDSPLDSPIEISASPRGKRTRRIHLLSGGERALAALALVFAVYLAKPSPFCLMDEVDAPLDETNIRRFIRMLDRFKSDTQFIIITHNPLTIEHADWVYGITMQEPGVSSMVGVEFGPGGLAVAH